MRHAAPRIATMALLSALIFASAPLGADAPTAKPGEKAPEKTPETGKLTDCEMTYTLKGWSAFYKTASGTGAVTCDNGQSAKVTIKVTGGGLTFGKSTIVDGKGKFSEVKSIEEIFGSYAESSAHAGAVKSAAAEVLTKGEVSLALAGTGQGVDIGIDFGKFTIEKAK